MRARGSVPQRETRTAFPGRPGIRPRPAGSGPAADNLRGERHDQDGHPVHEPGTLLDSWVRELIEAAPPLTGEQRHALALLLNTPAPVPARPPGAAEEPALEAFQTGRADVKRPVS
jgi:hypothetical protein